MKAFFPLPNIPQKEALIALAWNHLKDAYHQGASLEQQEDLYREIAEGKALVWLLMDDSDLIGAAVTQLWYLKAQDRKVLHVPLAGGDFLDSMDVIDEAFLSFSRANDVEEIHLTLRPAMAKLFAKDYGFKTKFVEVGKLVGTIQ